MTHQLPTAAQPTAEQHQDDAAPADVDGYLYPVRVPADEAVVYETHVGQDPLEVYVAIETRTSRTRLVMHAGDLAHALASLGILDDLPRAELDDARAVWAYLIVQCAEAEVRSRTLQGEDTTRSPSTAQPLTHERTSDGNESTDVHGPVGVLTEAQVEALAAASWTRQAGTSAVQLRNEEWHDRHRHFVRADVLAAGIKIVEDPRG